MEINPVLLVVDMQNVFCDGRVHSTSLASIYNLIGRNKGYGVVLLNRNRDGTQPMVL